MKRYVFVQGGVISLFAFLVYVNSLPGELHNDINSLYVDDLAGIYIATKILALIQKLLEDFKRIHASLPDVKRNCENLCDFMGMLSEDMRIYAILDRF